MLQSDDDVEIAGSEQRGDRGALAALARDFTGAVLTPRDSAYAEARKLWNGSIDVRPALIAQCRSTGDVVKAVRFAAAQGLAVSVRGGGHNVAGMALRDGGLVVDLRCMREVHVDVDARLARVEGGATLGDVDEATQRLGLATPTGFVSKTGLGGLLLRGGLGHTMRRFGLTCDQLTAVNLVTSDARARRLTQADDPELFWALRGGPLDYGVVTEFELRLHPLAEEVRLILAPFPAEQGIEVNRLLREYMRHAPRELGLVSFYVTLPASVEYPPSLRGREVILLFGMYSGERSKAPSVLAPVLEHPELIEDLGSWMPYPAAQSALDDDYPDGMRYYWKSLYLERLDDSALEVIHRLGTARPSPESTLDVWAMGGAIRDFDAESSAFPERDANYMIAIEANWRDPAHDAANVAWARRAFDELRPFSSGKSYLNFPGSREEHDDAVRSAYGRVFARLRAVQQRLDPAGMFARESR